MTCFDIYLEIDDEGWCMAHVPELIGCFSLAKTKEKALKGIPDAISNFFDSLKEHGEQVSFKPDSIEIKVKEEYYGTCPRISGNKAALFSWDRVPLKKEEIENCLRRMGYNREDLVTLVENLPSETLDWKPDIDKRSIREVLEHVARAEWWYISRMGDYPELFKFTENPSEGKLFEWLKGIREIAVKRLKSLTKNEKEKLFISEKYTDHPDEEWTARKVLRRFLEHEKEHIQNIRDILVQYEKSRE